MDYEANQQKNQPYTTAINTRIILWKKKFSVDGSMHVHEIIIKIRKKSTRYMTGLVVGHVHGAMDIFCRFIMFSELKI